MEFPLQIIPIWFNAVANPIKSCERILSLDEEKKQGYCIITWFSAFIFSSIVGQILCESLDLHYEVKAFLPTSICFEAASILVVGLTIQFGLWLQDIKGEIWDFATIYVSYFVVYQPLGALLGYPGTRSYLKILCSPEAHRGDFESALALIIRPGAGIQSAGFTFNLLLFLLFFSIASTLMGLEVKHKYKLNRVKCLTAMAVVVAIFVPPVFLALEFVGLYLPYTFWH